MSETQNQAPIEGFVSTSENQIHYLDWGGSGRQIHFLHGNGFCAGTYTPFLKYLTADYRICASDVRGHGQSSFHGLQRIRSWDIFADDLKYVIEKAMTPPVTGMGHSLGAVTTCIAAAKYPKLFSGLVLIDPVIFTPARLWAIALMKAVGLRGRMPLVRSARHRKRVFSNKRSAFERFASGKGVFKYWSPEFIEAYLACGLLEKDADTTLLTCDPELEAQIFESVPLNVWFYLKKVSCPVLAIRGAASDTFVATAARRLETKVPNIELATIPRAGHFVPMEQPRTCAQRIKAFLDSGAAASPRPD
jgi:pimeloyl-ACP methyl ester carboxylesterase